jgi:hypothetical protein
MESKYAVDCFTRDMARRRLNPTLLPIRKPPDPHDPLPIPVSELPDDLFTFLSNLRTRIRLNKYGLPQVAHIGGAVTPERIAHLVPRCFQTRSPRDVHLITSADIADDPDLFTICLDTGCSIAISHCKSDFIVDPISGNFGKMRTVHGTVDIAGFGLVEWTVVDTKGYKRILRMPAYYIPSSEQRLMSPQAFARYHGWSNPEEPCFSGNDRSMWLQIPNAEQVQSTLHVPISSKDCIPYFIASAAHAPAGSSCGADCTCASCPSNHFTKVFNMEVLADANENLSVSQKELLLDHARLGHIHMQHLQRLYRPQEVKCEFDGCVKTGSCLLPKSAGTPGCVPPLCLACQAAKAKRRPDHAKQSQARKSSEHALSEGQLTPGDRVHVDQYESAVRGRLPHTYGRESAASQYVGGTIFYDSASGLIKVYHQVSLGGDDTLASKRAFEAEAAQCGVDIKNFHCDNGIFTSKTWTEALRSNQQSQSLSGVGAHHQNAHAERAIGIVTTSARAMLLHLQIHWPDEFDTKLWPFALSYAAWLYNHIPKSNGLAPIEIFCGTRTSCDYLRRARVFGCPVYVLDPRLQDGKKIPKWEPRARRGQFLGFSAAHSTSVGLIRNINSNHVSPQFHFIADPRFETVTGGLQGRSITDITADTLHLFLKRQWDSTDREFSLSDWDTTVDGELPGPPPGYEPPARLPRSTTTEQPAISPTSPVGEPDFSPAGLEDPTSASGEPIPASGEPISSASEPSPMSPAPALRSPHSPCSTTRKSVSFDPALSSRPSRTPKPIQRFEHEYSTLGSNKANYFYRRPPQFPPGSVYLSADVRASMSLRWDQPSTSDLGQQLEELMAKSTCPISGDVLYVSPLCLKTKLEADSDVPSYNDITRMDTATQEEWIKAMNKELRTLYEFGVYETVDRSAAKGRQIVPSHWAFKIKRQADGSFLKYKARLTIRGDLQLEGLKEGTSVHDSDGYAPTVEFGTVRMLLTMSVMHGLHTTQVDWKNAFTQAHLDRPYFMEFPPGIRDLPHLQGKVMKLKRSLYGNKFAAKLFYNVVKEALTTPKSKGGPGFHVSQYDHCLFIRDDCIAINWVDDAIFLSKDPKIAKQVVQVLKKNGYDLDIESVEGGLRDYLGIDYQKMPDGKSLMCTQTGLIDRIIEATHLEDANPAHTPIVAPLGKCKNSESFNGNFNYRSVIGMLI